MSPELHPTTRFTDRVEDYIRFRPHYPSALLDFLRDELHLTPSHTIVDVGSGTGILSQLFLSNSNTVFAVEPNAAMRAAAERLLGSNPQFHSLEGTAEATGLPAATADFIAAGQAFHWFDPVRARVEFQRVLKPRGLVILVWNERLSDVSAFARSYEDLLRAFGIDYQQVAHRDGVTDGFRTVLNRFFSPNQPQVKSFPNAQSLDYDSLEGRLRSSSYAPLPGHPGFEPMTAALRKIFDDCASNGRVSFEYSTTLYYGVL